MSQQDRLLLSLAGVSGCVSCWLAFQSLTQRTLTPTSSASNIAFLGVVTVTIVTILVSRKAGNSKRVKSKNGRPVVNRRPLLAAGGAAALALLVLGRVFEGLSDPGDSTITMAREGSLAGFAGVGVLGVLLRMSYLRIRNEKMSDTPA